MSEIDLLVPRKNLLFVDKKKQKNFVNLMFCSATCRGPYITILLNKSFCFFFQKEDFLPQLNSLISLYGHLGLPRGGG